MVCSKCSGNTTVLETRDAGDEILRQRQCISCGYTFFTEEYEIENNKDMLTMWRKIKNEQFRKRNSQRKQLL